MRRDNRILIVCLLISWLAVVIASYQIARSW